MSCGKGRSARSSILAGGTVLRLTGPVPERRFDQLVRTHHRAVRTYASSFASSRTVAEDAVQETFLRAWRHLDAFRGDGTLEGWLIRICRRCVIDLERRERRAARPVERPSAWCEDPDLSGEAFAVLETLTRDHREVLVICGVLGYDYESAAAVLDLPVGTVRSRLHRARAAFAAALDVDDSRSA